MNDYINKKVTCSACTGVRVNPETNEFEDYTCVLLGKFNPVTASKRLRREEGDSSITINYVEEDTHTYRMPIMKFIADAEIVEE